MRFPAREQRPRLDDCQGQRRCRQICAAVNNARNDDGYTVVVVVVVIPVDVQILIGGKGRKNGEPCVQGERKIRSRNGRELQEITRGREEGGKRASPKAHQCRSKVRGVALMRKWPAPGGILYMQAWGRPMEVVDALTYRERGASRLDF